jgi:putative aminopeptidase FrvX
MYNLSLLKKLVTIPALAGDESILIRFLQQRAKKRWLASTVCPNQWIILGNVHAPTYVMAHIDEVGVRIIYAKESTLHLEWIGRVTPSMYIWRDIEIYTKQGIVRWIIVGKPLETQIASFLDLKVILAPSDYKKVAWWDTVRLRTVREESEEMLFASVLDNRLWVAQVLWSIEEMLQKWIDISHLARCFSTQEEVRNEWAIRILQKYMPKKMIIIDMIPYWLRDNIAMDSVHILESTLDYKRATSRDSLVQSIDYTPIDLVTDHMNRAEAMQFEAITWWEALHVFTPMYNYHHGTYALDKRVLFICTERIIQIIMRSK